MISLFDVYNGSTVTSEYSVWNPYNILVLCYFPIFCVPSTLPYPAVTWLKCGSMVMYDDADDDD